MSKKHLYHTLKILRKLSVWYFVTALIVSGFSAALALRQNNLRAIELRDKVLKVDKENGDVEGALRELREYTYSHMNSGLASEGGVYPPIQLKYRYERLVAAEKQRASGANESLATQAQNYCERLIPQGASRGRIDCIQNFMTTRGASEQPIPDALYKFDFASPLWSPDIAGWSLVVFGVVLVAFIARIMAVSWLKHSLRQHA